MSSSELAIWLVILIQTHVNHFWLQAILDHPPRVRGTPPCIVFNAARQGLWVPTCKLKLRTPFSCCSFMLCMYRWQARDYFISHSEASACQNISVHKLTKRLWEFSQHITDKPSAFLQNDKTRVCPEPQFGELLGALAGKSHPPATFTSPWKLLVSESSWGVLCVDQSLNFVELLETWRGKSNPPQQLSQVPENC